MADFGYPFDSQVNYAEDGTPQFDRALLSKDLRELFHKILTDGVILKPSNNLQVTQGDGMNVIVNEGFCIIQGAMKKFDRAKTLAVQQANASFDRIDTVVARFNDDIAFRNIELYVLKGVASADPQRPNLTRNESIYELGLADIFVAKGTTNIPAYRISDTRLDSNRCGEISALMEFDTTTLYNQIKSDLDNFQSVEKAEFDAWFENIKDTLSGDVAGNLQNQIGTLSQLTTSAKDNLVNAVNEVNAKEVEVIDSKQGIKNNQLPNQAVGALGLKEILGGKNMISFGVDKDGNYGYYKAGADTVTPFKGVPKLLWHSSQAHTYNFNYKFEKNYSCVFVSCIGANVSNIGNIGRASATYYRGSSIIKPTWKSDTPVDLGGYDNVHAWFEHLLLIFENVKKDDFIRFDTYWHSNTDIFII